MRPRANTVTIPAPVRGWVTNQSPAYQKADSALVLENWFPTSTGARMRAGSSLKATIGTDPVLSVFPYVSAGNNQMFAADAENVFDITIVADPEVAPTADITGQTSGYYSWSMVSTSGGNFLYIVNGTDSAQLYDGSAWSAITAVSSPIAITGATTSTFSHVWVWKNQVFFIQTGTMNAYSLPAGNIGGALVSINLKGVFGEGGALLFGSTQSFDAGDGLDDRCVFVTTEGEAAIFEGTDPSSASTWSLVGVYDVGPPLGQNATMKAGGDLVIATEGGLVPLSQAIMKDPAALSVAAISSPIEPDWQREADLRRTQPWNIAKWDEGNMAIVAMPTVGASGEACLVVNLETGAWGKYTGWDTNCATVHNGRAYFGTQDGTILEAEFGGSDNGDPFVATCVWAFNPLGARAAMKTAKMARASFRASKAFTPKVSASVNYTVSLPSPPNSAAGTSTSEWDVGLWDEAVWDAGRDVTISTSWVAIGAAGFAFAPQIQVTSGTVNAQDAEIISFDVVFEVGGVVV